MFEKKFDSLYSEIAKCIKEAIDINGSDVYLCVNSEFDEMIECKIYVKKNNEYKRYDDLIGNDGIDESEYWSFLDSLSSWILKLKKIYKEEEKKSFTSVNFHYSAEGNILSVEYGFEKIIDYNKKLLNEIVWEYKTLNIYPANKDEREMLQKFIEQENE